MTTGDNQRAYPSRVRYQALCDDPSKIPVMLRSRVRRLLPKDGKGPLSDGRVRTRPRGKKWPKYYEITGVANEGGRRYLGHVRVIPKKKRYHFELRQRLERAHLGGDDPANELFHRIERALKERFPGGTHHAASALGDVTEVLLASPLVSFAGHVRDFVQGFFGPMGASRAPFQAVNVDGSGGKLAIREGELQMIVLDARENGKDETKLRAWIMDWGDEANAVIEVAFEELMAYLRGWVTPVLPAGAEPGTTEAPRRRPGGRPPHADDEWARGEIAAGRDPMVVYKEWVIRPGVKDRGLADPLDSFKHLIQPKKPRRND